MRAIVLRIDSPGGSATASDVIWRELMITRDEKHDRPLVVSMSDLAASGGYYIAMAGARHRRAAGHADRIDRHLQRQVRHRRRLREAGRATSRRSASARHAEIDSPARPFTAEERAEDRRSRCRPSTTSSSRRSPRRATRRRRRSTQSRRAACGPGGRRKAIGLVDELGGLDRAIAVAKQRAKIPADSEVELVVYPPRRQLYEVLVEQGFRERPRALLRVAGAARRASAGPSGR